jgi:hypothetical protein
MAERIAHGPYAGIGTNQALFGLSFSSFAPVGMKA